MNSQSITNLSLFYDRDMHGRMEMEMEMEMEIVHLLLVYQKKIDY